jgi:hypothetical protein
VKARDLAIVVAVLAIGGFAAADAIRGRVEGGAETTASDTTAPSTLSRRQGPQPQPDAPPGWPQGTVQGELVFTDASDCRVRVIGLAGGRERPLARFAGNCNLWPAPVSQRIAYGLGPASSDAMPFRFASLERPQVELGGYRALFGFITWSHDGQRAAWCGRSRTGFDLELGGPARRLPRCPAAYTPEGEIAYAVENRLLVEDRTVLRADGGITFVNWGRDGSLAIVEDGTRLVRYDSAGRLSGSAETPEGRLPILSPDNCAAAFRLQNGLGPLELVDVGCFRGARRPRLVGRDAAWSPDGEWLAVAGEGSIVFHRLVGTPRTLRYPVQAVELAWR